MLPTTEFSNCFFEIFHVRKRADVVQLGCRSIMQICLPSIVTHAFIRDPVAHTGFRNEGTSLSPFPLRFFLFLSLNPLPIHSHVFCFLPLLPQSS